jgi:rhodanese-related sulfurtransferase
MMFLFGNINRGLEEWRNTENAVLLDVRERDEFCSGHIPGAINQPLSVMEKITVPKDKALFVYCLRGTRSKRAAGILKKMGYRAKSIGGIADYAGPVEK